MALPPSSTNQDASSSPVLTASSGTNDFQEGISEVRASIPSLIGQRVTCDKDHAFTQLWDGPQRVSGVVETVIMEDYFVAGVRFDNEGLSSLSAASFMLNTTTWDWAGPALRDDARPTPEGDKHARSMQRAYDLAMVIAKRVGLLNMKGTYIVILDGNGENRRAMENAFDELCIPHTCRPVVITLELNPNVALASALRFGRKHVRLTSGDFRMQITKGKVCGVERAILLDGHSVLTDHEKDNCIGLYLDYCGSPCKKTDFAKLYTRLPRLVGCAITVAKRQPNSDFSCARRRSMAAPPLERFELITTYDHDKVYSDMYALPLDAQAHQELHEKTLEARKEVDARIAETLAAKKRARYEVQKGKAAQHKKARSVEAARVQELIGTNVGIPLRHWPNNEPGPEYAQVMRRNDSLLFKITKSYHHYKCALRAIMEDGSLHPTTERFTLRANQAAEFAVLA